MKNILKRYYSLDNETKEILPFLYMYDALLGILQEYEDVEIESLADEEILMQTAIKCWYSMDMDPLDIMNNLLSILECQDITIKDLADLEIDDLKEIFEYKEASNIIDVFEYNGYTCALLKNDDGFTLHFGNEEGYDKIVLDSLRQPLSEVIKDYIVDKCLYKGNINNAESNSQED